MQSDVWGTISDKGIITHITGGNFAQSSITINGWLRDFLWAQASQVIQSYGSSLSAYGLFFLGAHFVWAFSLMFLFSSRGYWQELGEVLLFQISFVIFNFFSQILDDGFVFLVFEILLHF
jgi:photosystem I P700 chlorophyll a apoprotein A1